MAPGSVGPRHAVAGGQNLQTALTTDGRRRMEDAPGISRRLQEMGDRDASFVRGIVEE